MTIVRTTSGLLLQDNFDTNTLANYTRYEVIWSSTNKNINLGYYSYLKSKGLAVADSVVTLKFKTDNWGGSPTFHARYREGYYDSIYVSIGNVTQLMSGSTYLVYDGSVAYNTNTLYQIKMSLSGTRIKFKIWQDGTSEPSAWLYDVTDTNPVVSGGISVESSYPTLTVDNIGVYKSSNITCTGLPAGYKLRVGTITATASGGIATVDCSAVTFPVTSVEVLNASNVVVDTITPADGVWGGDAYSYQSLIAVSIGADTSRKQRKNTTFPTDTKRKARYTSWVGTDLRRRAVVLAIAGFDSLRRIRLGTSTLLDTTRHTLAFKTIASDSTRRVNESLATAGDMLRRNHVSTLATIDTYRKMRIALLSYNATLRRRVAQSILQADAVRRVKSAVVTSFDTGRQIITNLMAFINVNSKRNIKADTVAQTDTKRRARKLAELVADFERRVNTFSHVMGDTKRRAILLTQIATDGTRRVLTMAQAVANTVRQLINNSTDRINVDVKRILRVTLHVRPNSQRRLRKLTQFVGDTFQKITVRLPVILNTFRKVQGQAILNSDSTRRLRKAISFIADAVRRERVQSMPVVDSGRKVQVTTQAISNIWRKVKKLVQSFTDTKRRTAAVVLVVSDTARNSIRRYFDVFVVDTVRRLFNIKVREAPDYSWEELDDHFAVNELYARYDASEGVDRYSWEGDALKTYTLGEVKEVGLEITAQDGTAFSIVSATYVYKDMAGNVLASGSANIDDHKVFILLAPELAGFSQKVVFTITTQPLDTDGQPDLSKNREVLKPVVKVDVNEV